MGVRPLELSLAGILVCAALLVIGYVLRAPILIALFASLPFGATAIATLSGGATPLIFTAFVLALLAAVMTGTRFLDGIGVVFKSSWVPWLVLALMIYTFAGALILPRLFSGQMMVFIPIGGVRGCRHALCPDGREGGDRAGVADATLPLANAPRII